MNAAWPIMVVLIAFTPTAARAELPEPVEAPFALTVNEVAKGDIILVLQGDEVFIDRADLRAAGIALQGGEDVQISGRRLLRLSSLSPPLRYELDDQEIALRIIAPPEL